MYPETFGQTAGWVLQNVLAYAACWVLGMAHRGRDLKKVHPAVVLSLGAACVGGAPRMDWLRRSRPADGFVSMVSNRAVTICLWHNVAITIAVALFNPLQLWRIPTQGLEYLTDFTIALVLLAVAVLALGWVEDLAARRKPRISPFVRRPPLEPARGVAKVPSVTHQRAVPAVSDLISPASGIAGE
jgi:hypothetical protein